MMGPPRGTLAPDMARANHSMPSFPTQPLLSQALPSMPGVGIPGQPMSQPMMQPLTATASHSGGLNGRPGMAYQPRFVRTQYQGSSGHISNNVVPSADPSWTAGAHAPNVGLNPPGNPMWQEEGQWVPPVQGHPANGCRPSVAHGVQMRMGVPAVMTAGMRNGGMPEDEDDTPDTQQVEHTTRLMLSHLCLE